mmetsp:Transcript_1997/g.4637  ORF Transcript_1997/g.4637 Transcript_1997/m.4637 type:complete len:865 (-) Transcript_1997:130-2724(-)|eukprot:g16804.t1
MKKASAPRSLSTKAAGSKPKSSGLLAKAKSAAASKAPGSATTSTSADIQDEPATVVLAASPSPVQLAETNLDEKDESLKPTTPLESSDGSSSYLDDGDLEYVNETLEELVGDKKSETLYIRSFLNKVADDVLPKLNRNKTLNSAATGPSSVKLDMGRYRLLMNRLDEIEELEKILMMSSTLSPEHSTSASSADHSSPLPALTMDVINRAAQYDIPEKLLEAGRQRVKEMEIASKNAFYHQRTTYNSKSSPPGGGPTSVADRLAQLGSTSSSSMKNGADKDSATAAASLAEQKVAAMKSLQAEFAEKCESVRKLREEFLRVGGCNAGTGGAGVSSPVGVGSPGTRSGSGVENGIAPDELLAFFDEHPLLVDLPYPQVENSASSTAGDGRTILQKLCANEVPLLQGHRGAAPTPAARAGDATTSTPLAAKLVEHLVIKRSANLGSASATDNALLLWVQHHNPCAKELDSTASADATACKEAFLAVISLLLDHDVDAGPACDYLQSKAEADQLRGNINETKAFARATTAGTTSASSTSKQHEERFYAPAFLHKMIAPHQNCKSETNPASKADEVDEVGVRVVDSTSDSIAMPLPWPLFFQSKNTGVDVRGKTTNTGMIDSILSWHGRKILDQPADSFSFGSMLWCACLRGNDPEACRRLLQQNADANYGDANQTSCLMVAATGVPFPSQQVSGGFGAFTRTTTASGSTPATFEQRRSICQLLIQDYHALLHVEDRKGSTVVDHLTKLQQEDAQALKLLMWFKDSFAAEDLSVAAAARVKIGGGSAGGGGARGGAASSGTSGAVFGGGKKLTAEEVLSEANLSGPSNRAFQDSTQQLKALGTDEIRGQSARYQELKAQRDFADVMNIG